MSKQTLQALSAVPRSKITDSWVQTKKKPRQEAYNYQHWLIQVLYRLLMHQSSMMFLHTNNLLPIYRKRSTEGLLSTNRDSLRRLWRITMWTFNLSFRNPGCWLTRRTFSNSRLLWIELSLIRNLPRCYLIEVRANHSVTVTSARVRPKCSPIIVVTVILAITVIVNRYQTR
jgi:hypothetical protein